MIGQWFLWVRVFAGSCWRFFFFYFNVKQLFSCFLGRRRGRVLGYRGGKGFESLKVGESCLCRVNQEISLQLGKFVVRYVDCCVYRRFFLELNFFCFLKVDDILELRVFVFEQFILGFFCLVGKYENILVFVKKVGIRYNFF